MKKIFMFAVLLILSSSAFAQFDPGITGANIAPTSIAVGSTGVLNIYFDNSQVGVSTTPSPVNTITIQISPITNYMSLPNPPTTTGPNNFTWTSDGSGGWTGVNNVPMGAVTNQIFTVDVKGIALTTSGAVPINVEVYPNNPDVATGGQLQDNTLNNSQQPKVSIIAPTCTTPAAPTMSANVTITKGSSTTISASCISPATLTWTAGASGTISPLTVSPTGTTTYTATCTSGTCVSNAAGTTVTVSTCNAGTVAPSVF